MARIVFKDFSIEVRETVEELKEKKIERDFMEVTEFIFGNTDITDVKTVVNINHIILIRR